MARCCEFPVFDADNHLYETEEAFTRHLAKRYERAIEYVQARGRTKIAIRGTISEFIPNPTFDVVARPGAEEEYFRIGNPEGKSYRELVGEPMKSIPAFREPGARLALMDQQGVDRTLMFPTLASLLEERMRDVRRFAVLRVSRVRSLLEGLRRRRHPRLDALVGQRLLPLPERLDRSDGDTAVPARSVPFHEDELDELIDAIGADHVLFGSDYPHPEGLAEPCSYVEHLPPGLPEKSVAAIMGGNLARLMRGSA